ncbi:glycosyltransferase family 2 protein [Polaribacter sp. 20A6]|uniref:glycosyltransferase family 2 protein n=1 Tax=Polaribacter sp. 20A6 TaxID=2687289 RepID=UPI0013FE3F47|nr:glycosyltransferase family 2 protein [Polaribacter sp. 20A6]
MSLKYPKISIVTPNYNGAAFLEETIKSVLNQNYPNLEYIIIDGGSTDGSLEIIKKYEKHLAYWVSERDTGLYDAVQKGFEKSTGEIMAWINSDDMYTRGAFSIVSEIFSNFKDVHWLMGIPAVYDEAGRTIQVDNFKRWSKFMYYSNNFEWIQQESVFWRRYLWNASGAKINKNLKLAGDLELWTRFFRFEKLYSVHALLSGFRMRSKNQLSLENSDEYYVEANEVLKLEVDSKISESDFNITNKIRSLKKRKNNSNYFMRLVFNFFIKKIEVKHFNYAPLITFDRVKQSFIIKELE